MIQITMRGLRDTRKLKALLKAGESFELWDRKQLIAQILPPSKPVEKKDIKWPDFEARRRKILGDRVLPGADLLIEERGRY
jgi:hypothetical protein